MTEVNTTQNAGSSVILNATTKLIEQAEYIGSGDVTSTVSKVRSLIETDVSLDLRAPADLDDKVKESIDWASLPTTNKVTVNTLLAQIELYLLRRAETEGELSEEDATLQLTTLLDHIEEAAIKVAG